MTKYLSKFVKFHTDYVKIHQAKPDDTDSVIESSQCS